MARKWFRGGLATPLLLLACISRVSAYSEDPCSNNTNAENVALIMETGKDDATWVLTSAFVILTMQSGFGSLESGSVDVKFVVNVMMKNVIDVAIGGFSYWICGYGISFGESWKGILGTDKFFVNMAPTVEEMAEGGCDAVDRYSHYLFHFTFASTATTIVSGAVAGRMKFSTYMIFSFLNTILYALPCHWVWATGGFLYDMGIVDFAGDGPVHLMGGVNGLVGAWLVGPRPGRWDPRRSSEFGMQNPLGCIFGLFMLWWGWLGFNCGSTYGVSGNKWLVAARVAVTTINASIGGGVFGVLYSYCWKHKRKVDCESVINAILAALVGITGGCAAVSPTVSIIIGAVGAAICLICNELLTHYELIDDPVGAFGVHGAAAIWGLLAIGLFSDNHLVDGPDLPGLFLYQRAADMQNADGTPLNPGRLLWVQSVGAFTITVWTAISSWIFFKILDLTMGIRASNEDMETGFDSAEHGVGFSGGGTDWDEEEDFGRLPGMAKQIDHLRIEVYDARSTFEAQKWELEALRHRHDRIKEEVYENLGAEDNIFVPTTTPWKRAFPASEQATRSF